MKVMLIGIGLFTFAQSASSFCELPPRDQVLLIQRTESVPPAGLSAPVSLAGADVPCASVGSFRIVRHPAGGGMHVFDPNSAFSRWSPTGVYFSRGPSAAVSFMMVERKRYDLSTMWSFFGRGRYEEQELQAMSISEHTVLPFRPFRLMDEKQYRRALSERVTPEEQTLLSSLLWEKSRAYLGSTAEGWVRLVNVSSGTVPRNVEEIRVTVVYEELQGKQVVRKEREFNVAVNPFMPPYVGNLIDRSLVRPR